MTITLMVCLAVSIVHLYHKLKTYLIQLNIRFNNKTRIWVYSICGLLICLSLYKFMYIHKDVSIYILLSTGPICYMCSFFLCRSMNKYYFSFRLVCYQALQIITLAIASKLYPILYYQALNYYRLFACLLILVVLLINALIVYILVNVLRKDTNSIRETSTYGEIPKNPSVCSSISAIENV
jgi:hypothetical protein